MTSLKELLEVRNRMKGKKPDFIRQDIRKKARLKIKWRKPRGLDSKIRRKLNGRARPVSQGYRSPKKVRGIHKSGLQQFVVRTVKDMDNISPEEYCLVVASFGKKKKIEMLKKAKEKNFQVVNINADDYIKRSEEEISLKKKSRQEKQKGQKSEKPGKVEKKTEESIQEDKKEIEKKEKDKVLTKKEM